VLGHRPRLAQSHQGDHPLRRQIALAIPIAALLAILALLLLPPHARGNFVYWANGTPTNSIGRAKVNGTGLNDSLISGLNNPMGVAVDSNHVYWTDTGANRIGRANLDGSGVNLNFITTGVVSPQGIAVTANAGIFWANGTSPTKTIGHANIDGSSPNPSFAAVGHACGVAADQSFVYWLDNTNSKIGRVPVTGGAPDPNFVSLPVGAACGLAVDPSFLYWSAGSDGIGRVPVGGGTADPSFITAATGRVFGTSGLAVNPQYIFWGNVSNPPGSNVIGRANADGTGKNQSLITGVGSPNLMAAAPSNKITIDSITRKKRKGTAVISAKVPGPGQVTLNQTGSPQDANATAASIKQVGRTTTGASSFSLPVKPKGKTAKKLRREVQRKGKGRVKVKVFIHFVPAGVAGVPNTDAVTVTLVKQGKRK